MVKAAIVRLVSKPQVGGGLTTILVASDVGVVQAAVDAGGRSAGRRQGGGAGRSGIEQRPSRLKSTHRLAFM